MVFRHSETASSILADRLPQASVPSGLVPDSGLTGLRSGIPFGDRRWASSLTSQATSQPIDLGAVQTRISQRGLINNTHTSQIYQFSLAGPSSLNLALTGLSSDLDLRLYRDANSNGLADAGEEIGRSERANRLDEAINLAGLIAGTYLAQVYQYSGSSAYTLNLSTSNPSDLLPTEVDLGFLQRSRTVTGSISGTNTADIYRFSLSQSSLLNLTLGGLGGDADVRLIQDLNSNGFIDAGEVLAVSAQSGITPESLTLSLGAGTYYVQVYHYNGNTRYSLNLTPAAPNLPPGYNPITGYGLVDAAAAVARAIGQTSFAAVADLGGNQWPLDQINAPEVWAQNYTGQGIVVAVIDSGVDYTHTDLDANIWINSREIAGNGIDDDSNGFIDDIRGWDFIDNDNTPLDLNGHGTHVAGTIAAEQNGVGVTGVAYNAQIMPIRVLDASGSGSNTGVAAGVRYAANNGAQIINLSLGGPYSSELEAAIRYAISRGVVVVSAAGNEAARLPGFPASLKIPGSIAVGAIDQAKRVANFSNRAGLSLVDYVVAPGVNILSTTPNNTYEALNGTSMAAPHVSGLVALMLNANPTLTPTQVAGLLTQTGSSIT